MEKPARFPGISFAPLAAAAVAAAAAAGVFFNSLSGGFVYDDHTLVESQAHRICNFSLTGLLDIISNEKFGHYLPVRFISYMFDCRLWGMEPHGFHLTNLVLHAANAALVVLLVAAVYRMAADGRHSSGRAAWLAGGAAGLLFAIHPVMAEAVANISGRKELLATFFLLCCAHSWLRGMRLRPAGGGGHVAAALLFFVLASLSKASALAFPLVLIAADSLVPPAGTAGSLRARAERAAPFFIAAGLVLVLDLALSQKHGVINRFFGGSPWTHFLTVLKTPLLYLYNFAWPVRLSPEYSFVVEKVPWSPLALASIALWIVAALGFLAFRRSDRARAFLVAWVFLNLLPVMNIIPTAKLIADRYAYLPSIGLFGLIGCTLAGWTVRLAGGKRRAPGVAAAAALWLVFIVACCLLAARGVDRSREWQSDYSLFSSAAGFEPGNPLVLQNLGMACYERGEYARAKKYFNRTLEINPGDTLALLNLGAMQYNVFGDADSAVKNFKKAAELDPGSVQPWTNLAAIYLDRQEYEKALAAAKKALAADPGNPGHVQLIRIIIAAARRNGVHLKLDDSD